MSRAILNGIATHYEIMGDGPPLLMFSPGGFDARIAKWRDLGIYAKTRMLDHLAGHFRCILFDRRECGESGGKIERIGWTDYAAQGLALLDHLNISRAHFMGGCMGCSPVLAAATQAPERVQSMVLVWPVGGAKYRLQAEKRFAEHLAFAEANGLAAVVALARETGKAFGADPRGGPWASVIQTDENFAAAYGKLDFASYRRIASDMCADLFDRDTAPGAEPEALMACNLPALIIPGADASHARSAGWYLAECLPKSEFWDEKVEAQTEQPTAQKLLDFLQRHA